MKTKIIMPLLLLIGAALFVAGCDSVKNPAWDLDPQFPTSTYSSPRSGD